MTDKMVKGRCVRINRISSLKEHPFDWEIIGYVVCEDNWILSSDKHLIDDLNNEYTVLDCRIITDYVCVFPDLAQYGIMDTWRYVKRTAIKLDKEISIDRVLYVNIN